MKIKKEKMLSLIDESRKTHVVYAPQKNGAVTNFKKVEDIKSIDLKTVRTATPAKEAVFPQTELIYKVESDKVHQADASKPAILFGVRPCDARGIQVLDNFFLARDRKDGGKQPFEDPYWKEKRDKTLIIAIACEKPLSTCACSSLGIHPASEAGSDILLVPEGDSYQLVVSTEKGKAFIEANKSMFEDGEDAKADQEKVKKACESMMIFKLDTSKAGQYMKLYESPIWQKVSQGCISCGVCTFFCPTCHCFEMRDRKTGAVSCDRDKCWDSCHFTVYSLEASGHNPRPDVAARYRNKILDKYQYHMTLYGEIACTGCGRCSDLCPSGISLSETLKTLGGAL